MFNNCHMNCFFKKTLFFCLYLFLIFNYSCVNTGNKIEEIINTGSMMTDSYSNESYRKLFDEFNTNYKNTCINKDTTSKTKLNDFYMVIMGNLNYIDSLKTEVNKLDNLDTENVKILRVMFINNGIADSVFNKVNASCVSAQSISMKKNKYTITEYCNNLLNDKETLKKNLFSINNPSGVSMLLYGFQFEILNIGNIALSQ